MSERLLTKCCLAEQVECFGDVWCKECQDDDPHMEWVEMCDHCKRPGRYCECP